MTEVLLGDGREPALLVAIHCCLSRLHVPRCASLDLDKTQHAVIPTYQVDLASPPRRTKIPRYHHVTKPPKIEVSILFATPPGFLVRGNTFRTKRPLRHPIQRPHRNLRDPP